MQISSISSFIFCLLRICAEEQIFIDGQLLEHAATLRHLAHSHADQLMTGNLVYLVSVIDDGAALYRNEAHDALHRGGLARSVCADERDSSRPDRHGS